MLAYRVFGPALPPEAFMAMTVLVVGAMSSYAQCLFGLDGEGGLSRYRLLPVRGWQLLLAKDAAFLAVVIPLTLPLAVLPESARRWWRWRLGTRRPWSIRGRKPAGDSLPAARSATA